MGAPPSDSGVCQVNVAELEVDFVILGLLGGLGISVSNEKLC